MKTHEIRVGNFVYYEDDHSVCRVEPIDIVNLQNDEEMFEPIPLTGEWLTRLGFNNEKDNVFVYNNIKAYVTHSWFVIVDNANPISVKYVHTLQDIVYCLTGKQLKPVI